MQCFARLKYRPVTGTGKNHSFWYIKDSAGAEHVIDAGPTLSLGRGFLNDWIQGPPTGHYPADNISAPTSSGGDFEGKICDQVDNMLGAALKYQIQVNDTIKYHGVDGPNSNSFARWLGVEGSFYPPSPPDAQAWGTAMPILW
jgi:hypothetical protein